MHARGIINYQLNIKCMESQTQREKVIEVINNHHLGVIATASPEGKPDAAVVAFKMHDNFEIWFATYDSSRKCHNLKTNLNVAFVVGWDHGQTVQYDGVVEVLSDEEKEQIKLEELGIMPTVVKYIHQEQAVFYKIKPRRIRYSDFSIEPWERFELTIF